MLLYEKTSIRSYGSTQKTSSLRRKGGKEAAESTSFLESEDAQKAHAQMPMEPTLVSLENMSTLETLNLTPMHDKNYAHHQKEGVSYGHTLLDAMESLRTKILMGTLSHHDLRTLKAQMDHVPTHLEPRLEHLIQDIRIRVCVELAKYNVSGA